MKTFSFLVRMRDLLLPIAIGCFIGSCLLIYAAWPTPEPDLWTRNSTVDLGDVYQQQNATAKFEIVNHFSQDVEIIEVLKGCSCSDATLTTKKLKPRDNAILDVTWRTGSTRGRNGVTVDVVYRLENGEEYHKLLRIEANVIPDISYEPKNIVFEGTKPETLSIQLSSGRMSRFALSNARSNHRAFKAQVRNADVVDVTFDGKTPVYANGLEPFLILETDSPNEPSIHVPLKMRTPCPSQ